MQFIDIDEFLPMQKRNDMDIKGLTPSNHRYVLFLRSLAQSCSTISPTRRRSGSVSFSRVRAMPCARSSSRGEPVRSSSSSGQERASAISDNRPNGGTVAPRSKRDIVSCSTPIASASSAWVSCRCWRRTAIARPIFKASRFSFGVILPPLFVTTGMVDLPHDLLNAIINGITTYGVVFISGGLVDNSLFETY